MVITAALLERFLAKLKVCKHGWTCRGCCWEWMGARSKETGHGHLFVSQRPRKNIGPHVLMWMWFNERDVPNGKEICHTCDQGWCLQPYHLWAGTHGENMIDAHQKGRKLNPVYLYPERVQRGNQHWSRRHPERVQRGDQHWSHRHPEWHGSRK